MVTAGKTHQVHKDHEDLHRCRERLPGNYIEQVCKLITGHGSAESLMNANKVDDEKLGLGANSNLSVRDYIR